MVLLGPIIENWTMKIIMRVFFISFIANGQSIDEQFTQKKMKQDFEIFKQISKEVNSLLYKHRTKQKIYSIYNWGSLQIEILNLIRQPFSNNFIFIYNIELKVLNLFPDNYLKYTIQSIVTACTTPHRSFNTNTNPVVVLFMT